jgi:hypothetical protein
MEPEGSLPYSQEYTIELYPEPVQSSSHPYTLFHFNINLLSMPNL